MRKNKYMSTITRQNQYGDLQVVDYQHSFIKDITLFIKVAHNIHIL